MGLYHLMQNKQLDFYKPFIILKLKKSLYTLGLSYRYTGYDDNTPATLKKDNTHLPGVFIQNEIIKDPDKSLLLGIRYDYNSNYGNVLTPRINFKRSSKEKFYIKNGFWFRLQNSECFH